MKNKVLAMLLALCMVMSLLPVTVFAATCDKGTATTDCAGKDDNTVTHDNQCVTKCTGSADNDTCANKDTAGAVHKAACPESCTAAESGCPFTGAASKHKTSCGSYEAPQQADDDDADADADADADSDSDSNGCPLNNADCVAVAELGTHSRGCRFYCVCTLNAAGDSDLAVESDPDADAEDEASPACGHHEGPDCPELMTTENTLCSACKAAKAVADAAAAPARDCGADDEGTTDCRKSTHEASCPASCAQVDEVTGCNLTAGHTAKHKAGTACTEDTRCNAAAGSHEVACPNYVAAADTTTTGDDGSVTKTRTERVSKVVPVTDVTCICDDCDSDGDLHEGVVVSGSHSTAEFTVNVTVYAEISYPVVLKDDGTEDAAKTAQNRAAALAAVEDPADDTGDVVSLGDAPEAVTWSVATVDDADKYCAYCKAAIAAEKVVAEADKYALCNMSINCRATKDAEGNPVDGKHKPDCLSLCTMDAMCGNTEGDANAHRVQYLVIKSTTNARNMVLDGEDLVSWAVNTSADAVEDVQVGINFDTYAEARAYALDQPKYTEEGGTGTVLTYAVRAIHCEKSGGVDSTVLTVAADGTVTETPEENDGPITDATKFTDMQDWMVEGVQFMLDKGWMEGMGDGKFGGTDTLKTDMVLTVLARMNGETITGSTWAEDAKAWAEKNAEIFEGIDLSSDSMARKDVVLVLWRQAGKPDSTIELEFDDVDGLEGDHLTAMKWAVEKKIVVGNGDGTMTPDGNVTRAQLSLMAMRAFNNK